MKAQRIVILSLISITLILLFGFNAIAPIPTIASQIAEDEFIDEIVLDCIDPECEEEIPLPPEVEEILDEITEPEPPVTSDDDPITQIEDELVPPVLTIGVTRIYTHEDGVTEKSDVITQELTLQSFLQSFTTPLQSFITEKGSFRNLLNSNMTVQLDVITDKQVLDGRVTLTYLINGEKSFQTTHTFKGVSQDEKFVLKTKGFIIGEMFKTITKPRASFGTIEVEMTEMFVFLEGEENFAITEPIIIYTVDVQRDLDKIISTNEKGNPVKIFPTDDTLKICSVMSNAKYAKAQCTSSTKGKCNRFRLPITSWTDRPELGAIVIKDKTGNILASTTQYTTNAINKASPVDLKIDTKISVGVIGVNAL